MRKMLVCLCVGVIGSSCFSQVAWADEVLELKAQLKAMQRQMQEQARQMEAMQRQYREQMQTVQVMEQKIASLESGRQIQSIGVEAPGRGVLDRLVKRNSPTMKKEWLEISGELELEYLDAQTDDNADGDVTTASGGSEGDGRFQIDKFVLTTKVNFSEDIYWKNKLEFQPGTGTDDNTVDIDNSYLMVKHLLEHLGLSDPTGSYLSVGLKDPFEKPHRDTENYNLISTAFHRDEEIGIQLGGQFDPFYWRFSVSNGNELNDRSPNDDSSDFEIIHDNELNVDENANKEVSFGLGIDKEMGSLGQLDVLGFYNTAHLSNEDITFLRGIAGYSDYSNAFQDDTNWETGVRADYHKNNLHLWGIYITAEDGAIDRDGFTLEASYKFKLPGVERNGRRYLTAIQPVFNYSQLNVGLPPVVTDARTWDREKYILALIADLTKNMKLKLEYAFNDEKTGGSGVNNDEFVGQLELKF